MDDPTVNIASSIEPVVNHAIDISQIFVFDTRW